MRISRQTNRILSPLPQTMGFRASPPDTVRKLTKRYGLKKDRVQAFIEARNGIGGKTKAQVEILCERLRAEDFPASQSESQVLENMLRLVVDGVDAKEFWERSSGRVLISTSALVPRPPRRMKRLSQWVTVDMRKSRRYKDRENAFEKRFREPISCALKPRVYVTSRNRDEAKETVSGGCNHGVLIGYPDVGEENLRFSWPRIFKRERKKTGFSESDRRCWFVADALGVSAPVFGWARVGGRSAWVLGAACGRFEWSHEPKGKLLSRLRDNGAGGAYFEYQVLRSRFGVVIIDVPDVFPGEIVNRYFDQK